MLYEAHGILSKYLLLVKYVFILSYPVPIIREKKAGTSVGRPFSISGPGGIVRLDITKIKTEGSLFRKTIKSIAV